MIRHLSYLSIASDQRRSSAKKIRDQIRGMMAGNLLTADQVKVLKARLTAVDAWERGTLQDHPHAKPPQPPQLPAAAPKHHTIELTDGVRVGESIKG